MLCRKSMPQCQNALTHPIQFLEIHLVGTGGLECLNDLPAQAIRHLPRQGTQIPLDIVNLRRLGEEKESTWLMEYLTDLFELSVGRKLLAIFPAQIPCLINANSSSGFTGRHIIVFSGPTQDLAIHTSQYLCHYACLLPLNFLYVYSFNLILEGTEQSVPLLHWLLQQSKSPSSRLVKRE